MENANLITARRKTSTLKTGARAGSSDQRPNPDCNYRPADSPFSPHGSNGAFTYGGHWPLSPSHDWPGRQSPELTLARDGQFQCSQVSQGSACLCEGSI
jgi:hypothetical protein